MIIFHIFSPERSSYLSILPDENADIFAASLLILYCTFSFLFLSSVVMIIVYILTKIFILKREELSDARVVSITKKEYGSSIHCLQRFIKSWKSISDELLNANFWSSQQT